MKKISLLLLCCCFISAKAQVFKYKFVTDRFEDIVSQKEKKTIITMQDSIISFEEKGKKVLSYVILGNSIYSNGNKDSLINVGQDNFAYIEEWSAIKSTDYPKYKKDTWDLALYFKTNNIPREEWKNYYEDKIEKYFCIITHFFIKDTINTTKSETWEIKPVNKKLHRTKYANFKDPY